MMICTVCCFEPNNCSVKLFLSFRGCGLRSQSDLFTLKFLQFLAVLHKINIDKRNIMTRGNQRDLARAKNQKKQQEMAKKKATGDGLSLEARKHRDAEVMREKQKKKEEAEKGVKSK